MNQESRKSKRYNRFLPIQVQAYNHHTDEVVAGPYPVRIINISRHGACLLLSQISSNSFHMFHSVKDDDTMCLQLTISIQPEINNCMIPGQPVWVTSFREGDIHAFKLGIEFTRNPEENEMHHLEQIISKR